MRLIILQLFVLSAVLSICAGCAGGAARTSAVAAKYLDVPLQQMPVDDSEAFWRDEELMYREGRKGNEPAIRAFLRVFAVSDGAISEGMHDEMHLMRRQPDLCKRVMLGDPELRENERVWGCFRTAMSTEE